MPLFVPEDCNTLKEAVARVEQDSRITTIVLGEGNHVVEIFQEWGTDSNYLDINSAMQIVGRPDVPKEKIVVMGGIFFKKGIPGNCHLQHLTLRQAMLSGVCGLSSFTMDDVLVEQCNGHGVFACGTGGVRGRRRTMYQRGSAPMRTHWSACTKWCLHHIDRCQDDGAPQLYKRRQ